MSQPSIVGVISYDTRAGALTRTATFDQTTSYSSAASVTDVSRPKINSLASTLPFVLFPVTYPLNPLNGPS